jgi:hypothetical protein
LSEDEDEEDEMKAAEEAEAVGQARVDALREEMKRRAKDAENYIVTAARLIAPGLDKNNWVTLSLSLPLSLSRLTLLPSSFPSFLPQRSKASSGSLRYSRSIMRRWRA